MPLRIPRSVPAPLRAAAALLACAGLAAGPSSPAAPAPSPPPATTSAPAAPKPPVATAAMRLNAQAVLVVPVQSVEGLPWNADRATAELLFALGERDQATRWITPDALRHSLAGSPGYAPDPAHLPADPFLHHGERKTIEPLAGILRRYGALVDSRLVLVPQRAVWMPAADGRGAVRMGATLVDTRTGFVMWFGEAEGKAGTSPDDAALGTAAAALAERMLAAPPA
jgi:hypothetical protein